MVHYTYGSSKYGSPLLMEPPGGRGLAVRSQTFPPLPDWVETSQMDTHTLPAVIPDYTELRNRVLRSFERIEDYFAMPCGTSHVVTQVEQLETVDIFGDSIRCRREVKVTYVKESIQRLPKLR